MTNIRLLLEYDGSHFAGWQEQPGQMTIAGSLKEALSIFLREEIKKITASGRTDAGVHALGQVANFHTEQEVDLDKLAFGVSSLLRNKVAVLKAEIVSDDFHSRFNARQKTYMYKILNRRPAPVIDINKVWHIAERLDLDLMRKQSEYLLGEHNFQSFRDTNCGAKTAIRKIYKVQIDKAGDIIEIRVTGNGFLKQMVRIIVGTLVEYGLGKRPDSIQDILQAKRREIAGKTAPAWGLYLEEVWY